jgi:hypothetical protein
LSGVPPLTAGKNHDLGLVLQFGPQPVQVPDIFLVDKNVDVLPYRSLLGKKAVTNPRITDKQSVESFGE